MKICTNCQTSNEEDSKFCNSCGSTFNDFCSKCGESIEGMTKFCRHCGTPIGGQVGAPTGTQPVAIQPNHQQHMGQQQVTYSNGNQGKDDFYKTLKWIVIAFAVVILGIVGWYFTSNDSKPAVTKAPEVTTEDTKAKEAEKEKAKAAEAQKLQAQMTKEAQQAAVNRLMEFESVLKSMADDINGGSITSGMATQSFRSSKVQHVTIDSETMNRLDPTSRSAIQDMNNLQKERMNAMFDGLRGYQYRYAEGGKMYDLFYSKLDEFKSARGL